MVNLNPVPYTSFATWGDVPESMWEVEHPYLARSSVKWMSLEDMSFEKWDSTKIYVDMEASSGDILASFKKHAETLIAIDSCSAYQDDAIKATEDDPESPRKFTGYKRPKKSDGNWTAKRK